MSIKLENQLDDARTEREAIRTEGTDILDKMHAMVKAYAAKHQCKALGALDHIDDLMADLIDDATGPVSRRIVRLEDEIGALEERDLRRNSPAVI